MSDPGTSTDLFLTVITSLCNCRMHCRVFVDQCDPLVECDHVTSVHSIEFQCMGITETHTWDLRCSNTATALWVSLSIILICTT